MIAADAGTEVSSCVQLKRCADDLICSQFPGDQEIQEFVLQLDDS